jgi:hypothetical protein
MGFLTKAIEEQAEAALTSAAQSGEVSFLCIRCDRVSTDPEGVKASLCPTCRKWMANVRLYPVPLIWGMAVVTGPFTAGAMAALTWHRIGDRRKTRIVALQLLACMVGILLYGPTVFLPPVPFAAAPLPFSSLIWMIVTAAVIGNATAGLGPLLTAHGAAGGRRANPVIPVLLALILAAPGGWLWVAGIKKIVWG